MHSCIEPGLRLCDGRMLSKHVLSVYYVAGSQMDVTLTLMLAALVATRDAAERARAAVRA